MRMYFGPHKQNWFAASAWQWTVDGPELLILEVGLWLDWDERYTVSLEWVQPTRRLVSSGSWRGRAWSLAVRLWPRSSLRKGQR